MKTLGNIPSLENLMCFVAAAEQMNFGRAARQLALSAAAFGQRIKQLEQQLGCALFARTSRSMALTLEGHRLLPMAQRTVREALLCADVLHQGEQSPVYLTVGTRFELGLSWFVPSLIRYQEELPWLTIDFYFGSGPDILEKLRARELDAIVTSAPQLHRSWASAFLHTEVYTFVGARSLLHSCPLVKAADATSHTLLDIDEGLPLTRYLTSAAGDLPFGKVRLCGAGAAVLLMVLEGLGVAVLPKYMVEPHLVTGELVQIWPEKPLLTDSFRLIYPRDSIFQTQLEGIATHLAKVPLC